ncbi:3-hydroxyacyl-CoA dehydrogenase family protein [Saccharothrix longispora]|uniref:3-hydroxybutyryl-CoA dehydrogenase n=1 Tax=Saccharothrix longispora TaxID=33920 RepID=A0ABU1PUC5_9PSEU|nr:3-hydroxyacyl-CoA dehydrogenase family protein [Saccharothrix longispora]MDR6594243.1 3-hydroxybutyryl-CoA dehydrogenase [Saccharothrix longispora]
MRVGVVGAGVMGAGVAQCFAASGHDVVVVDPDPAALAAGPGRVRAGVRLRALAGGTRVDPAEVSSRLRWTAELGEVAGCGFVVECAPERVAVKERLFAELDGLCAPDAVLASCTSAIPVAVLAAATAHPDRVLVTHFMNPAPVKEAVEVARGPRTSDAVLARVVDVLSSLGKTAIVVSDAPGFVTNRVLMLAVNEAVKVVAEGTAPAATVDRVFEQCFAHATGPLRTADLIGLDTVRDTLLVLRDLLSDPAFTPCPLLTEMVESGRLGAKSGQGFHTWRV